jgi:phosphoadenosine phosphosulfate reductase
MDNSIVSSISTVDFNQKVAALEQRLQHIADTSTVSNTLNSNGLILKPFAFASSLSMEDQVILDAIIRLNLTHTIEVFTLNTGRLHTETLAVINAVKHRYNLAMTVYEPSHDAVVQHVQQHGEFAFYDSVELRKACCNIRKVEPLNRALIGRLGWITGQRREQSTTRTELLFESFDDAHGCKKFNPILDWSSSDIKTYIEQFNVPINVLHNKGYPSIGCEPCTRAIKPGEDERAGRWWWENANTKECGLHKNIK